MHLFTSRQSRLTSGLLFVFLLCSSNPRIASSQDLASDSLALVALYNATGGPAWTNNSGWLTGPVSTWHGVTVVNDRVEVLSLRLNNLEGEIPVALANLDRLTILEIDTNKLSGPIPPELGSMTTLTELRLNDNQMTGPIPTELGALTNLVDLSLHRNKLSDSIPTELGGLVNLTKLWIDNNDLTGIIPAVLGALTKLQTLKLDSNLLTGSIPTELGAITGLDQLVLDKNQLTGPLPAQLSGLTNLTLFSVSDNQFSGPVPDWITDFTGLKTLDLANNQFTGNLPAAIGNLSELGSIKVNNNPMEGTLPQSMINLTKLFQFLFQATGLCESLDPAFQVWLAAVNGVNPSGCTNVGIDSTTEKPLVFELQGNYPNPFNPSTTIRFSLPEATAVSLRIFDLTGSLIRSVTRPVMTAGEHSVAFEATNLPSGVYVYHLQAGQFSATRKMVLLK